MKKHDCVDDKFECAHDIRVVLELPEAGFDIICMDSNVPVGECDSEIPEVSKEVSHDRSKCSIELCAIFGGDHEIDGDGVHGGMLGRIENESVLLAVLDPFMLCDE